MYSASYSAKYTSSHSPLLRSIRQLMTTLYPTPNRMSSYLRKNIDGIRCTKIPIINDTINEVTMHASSIIIISPYFLQHNIQHFVSLMSYYTLPRQKCQVPPYIFVVLVCRTISRYTKSFLQYSKARFMNIIHNAAKDISLYTQNAYGSFSINCSM